MELIFDNRNKTARLQSFQNFNNPQRVEMRDKPNRYQQKKETARAEAQVWQFGFNDRSDSWGELYEAQQHLERLGKRYGLINEFRENGIL